VTDRRDGNAASRCRWCGRRFVPQLGPGRPRAFCRRSCRQRDYEARRRATEVGLDTTELIVARDQLHRLYDELWVLDCAIHDVDQDLAHARTIADHRAALDWLLDAARRLVALPR
jgi:hypothetical protein